MKWRSCDVPQYIARTRSQVPSTSLSVNLLFNSTFKVLSFMLFTIQRNSNNQDMDRSLVRISKPFNQIKKYKISEDSWQQS